MLSIIIFQIVVTYILTYMRKGNFYIVMINKHNISIVKYMCDFSYLFCACVVKYLAQCDLSQTMETNQADVGYVCLWLLKNSSYPDFVTETECGAICLNFHQEHAYNLVVGFRDGGLAVYNISIMSHKPTYKTDLAQTRHMDCVRQVTSKRINTRALRSGSRGFYTQGRKLKYVLF